MDRGSVKPRVFSHWAKGWCFSRQNRWNLNTKELHWWTQPLTIKDLKVNITGWWFQPIWKIVVKMNHFPKVRGENKQIFEITTTQRIYHFPLGNGRTSPKLNQKHFLNPSHQGPWSGSSSTWQSQDFQRAPAPPFCLEVPPFSPLGLASASVRFNFQLPSSGWIHRGGNMQLMTGNLEIRWVRKPVWGWEVYPSMRPIFFLNQVFETSQVVFSPEFRNHQQYYRAKIRMVWGAYLGDSLILQWKNHVTGTPRGKKHLPTNCKFFHESGWRV